MNTAHVFQEKYTGVQIFVYHSIDELQAKLTFAKLVKNYNNWSYIGEKTANYE